MNHSASQIVMLAMIALANGWLIRFKVKTETYELEVDSDGNKKNIKKV